MQWARANKMRFYVLAIAVAVDFFIWLALRNNSQVDRATLDRFAIINISILSVDAALALAMQSYAALRRTWVLAACAVFEAFTILVWIQATGTLSSYFVLTGALLIIAYRLGSDVTVASAAAAAIIAFHFCAIVLEMAGVLTPEALFIGSASRIYDMDMYKWMAINSIMITYGIAYIGANAYVHKMREQEHALREVREEAAQIAAGARHGRLSGTLVADEYALGELIGRGGMGEIYMARRVSDQTNVAVKVLHPHLIESGTSLERFRREARAAERIPVQFTARILDVGSDEQQSLHFIVMEYLRGEDMGALLRRRGPLSVSRLLPIIIRVAHALDAAHAAGIVHRDLKPSNVFLLGSDSGNDGDAGPDVRLLDFGISKMLDDSEDPLTRADAVLGTIGYMAPEQALSRLGEVGPAADRFAFAAMIYRALCGRVPFIAHDIASVINALLRTDPPPPTSMRPDLAKDVDVVIAIGMAKKPGERYASAMAMVEHLKIAAANCLDEHTRERGYSLTHTATQTADTKDD